MKLKHLAVALLLSITVASATTLLPYQGMAASSITLVESYQSAFTRSEVALSSDGLYHYYYTLDTGVKYDVSNFEVFYTCPDTPILNPTSNFSFTGEFTNKPGFKFDSIQDDQEVPIWFSFSSPNAPEMGELRWQAGQINTTELGFVPSCHIPENGVAGLGAVGAFLILRRRRFH
jgi:hypothetical protein